MLHSARLQKTVKCRIITTTQNTKVQQQAVRQGRFGHKLKAMIAPCAPVPSCDDPSKQLYITVHTWSFELSLISAHLEKNCLLGVFSRSGRLCFLLFIFRKKWVSFLVQLASFPVQWASFPVPCQEMGMFFWSGCLFLEKWSWQKLVPSEFPGMSYEFDCW